MTTPTIEDQVAAWVEETALKIITIPYFTYGIEWDGEIIQRESPSGYLSFSQWLDCTTDMIMRLRGDIDSVEDEENFNAYDAIERAFPVLASTLDNSKVIGPLTEELRDILSKPS